MFSKQQWSFLAAELAVVVLGILIAFQVEEWREERVEQREIDAALVRLKDETRGNLSTCEYSVRMAERQARLAQVVLESLQAGGLAESDRADFEAGLVKLHWLVYPPFRQTVAQEMLSTGLLKSVKQQDLRAIIAWLPNYYDGVQVAFQQQRTNALRPKERVEELVTLRYNGSFDHSMEMEAQEAATQTFENATSVFYDFDQLAADTNFVNLVVRASSNQIWNFGTNTRLCTLFADVDSMLTKYGYE